MEVNDYFLEWVTANAIRGVPPTPESVRKLGEQFVAELQSSEKGKKEADAGTDVESKGSKEWNVKDAGKALRNVFNEK